MTAQLCEYIKLLNYVFYAGKLYGMWITSQHSYY